MKFTWKFDIFAPVEQTKHQALTLGATTETRSWASPRLCLQLHVRLNQSAISTVWPEDVRMQRAALFSHVLTMFLGIKISAATFGDALTGDGAAAPASGRRLGWLR